MFHMIGRDPSVDEINKVLVTYPLVLPVVKSLVNCSCHAITDHQWNGAVHVDVVFG